MRTLVNKENIIIYKELKHTHFLIKQFKNLLLNFSSAREKLEHI